MADMASLSSPFDAPLPHAATTAPTALPTAPRLTLPDLRPAAILWDMDGTLIDTEPYWMGAEAALVHRFGGQWTDADGIAMVGMPLVDGARIMQSRGVPLDIPEIVDTIVAGVGANLAEEVPWQPGASEVLTELRDLGIPMALVTASYDSLAAKFIDAAPTGTFQAVVTGERVTRGKPHPEPYLTAAEQLGVDIADCVVFEDSVPGVASGLASGARVVGVRASVPIPHQFGLSRLASLRQLDDAVLTTVLRGATVDFLGAAD